GVSRLGARGPPRLRGRLQAPPRRALARDGRRSPQRRHPQLPHLPPWPHALRLLRDGRPRPHHRNPARRPREPALERAHGRHYGRGHRPAHRLPLPPPQAVEPRCERL
ncbi:MAG: L-rhamnose mutarotase, partial [uncultured Rubellimicrobium sp.]